MKLPPGFKEFPKVMYKVDHEEKILVHLLVHDLDEEQLSRKDGWEGYAKAQRRLHDQGIIWKLRRELREHWRWWIFTIIVSLAVFSSFKL